MSRLRRAVLLVSLLTMGSCSPVAAHHIKVQPLPGAVGASVDQRADPSTIPVADVINDTRPANLPGRVSASAGTSQRPSISFVRRAGDCRSAGIVPPLGVGRFGEPGIGSLPICASTPGQPAQAPPPPTPLEAAYYAWLYVIDLPSPTASTQPAVGITGLDTFLTIQGEQRIVRDVTALGFDVHFDITSVYDVDWDDPRPDGTKTGAAVTRNHRDQGGPYPHGTLRHQYIERGSASITITQRWSASWSAGGEGGTLPDSIETTGGLTLPIQEIQAVVTG